MKVLKWLVALELYGVALASAGAGHSSLAIALAVLATGALLVALELGADLDDEPDEVGLTIERLALVLVYAWRAKSPVLVELDSAYVDYCRRVAIGLEREVSHGQG